MLLQFVVQSYTALFQSFFSIIHHNHSPFSCSPTPPPSICLILILKSIQPHYLIACSHSFDWGLFTEFINSLSLFNYYSLRSLFFLCLECFLCMEWCVILEQAWAIFLSEGPHRN